MVSSAAPTPLVPYFLSVPQLGNLGALFWGGNLTPRVWGQKPGLLTPRFLLLHPPPSFVEEGGVVSRMVSDKMKRNLPVAE